jgi:hypothetical protein
VLEVSLTDRRPQLSESLLHGLGELLAGHGMGGGVGALEG